MPLGQGIGDTLGLRRWRLAVPPLTLGVEADDVGVVLGAGLPLVDLGIADRRRRGMVPTAMAGRPWPLLALRSDSAFRHGLNLRADMDRRLPLDALSLKAAPVDPGLMACLL
jgi:hypothetical protein